MPCFAKPVRPSDLHAGAVVLGVAWLGGALVRRGLAMQQQQSITTTPSFQPPRWVFGAVWTTLYVVLAVALAERWRSGDSAADLLAVLFLHVLWCGVFFALGRRCEALPILLVLLLAAIVSVEKGGPSSSVRVGMVAHAVWCGCALLLNVAACRATTASS